MNIKSNLILLLFFIGIFLAFEQQPCQGMVRKLLKNKEDIVRQAREQISLEKEMDRSIQREILTRTRDEIDQPEIQPDSQLSHIKERIDQLLEKDEVKLEEIDGVREDLDRLPDDQIAGLEPSEHRDLSRKLDIAYRFTKLRTDYSSTVNKLDDAFDELADDNEKATFRFNASFIANIVMILGLFTRVGGIATTKLERQLKRLQIVEKKAKLEKDGIKPEKYL